MKSFILSQWSFNLDRRVSALMCWYSRLSRTERKKNTEREGRKSLAACTKNIVLLRASLPDFVFKRCDSLKASLRRYLRQTHSRTTICVISPVITLIRVKSVLARQRETLSQKLTTWNSRPFSHIARHRKLHRLVIMKQLIYPKLLVPIDELLCRTATCVRSEIYSAH